MDLASVGCVGYINALPFYLPIKQKKIDAQIDFFLAPPAKLNQMLRTDLLPIALTSSYEYLLGDLQFLPGYGIASKESILSVNFYTKRPLASLNGLPIGLTNQSATSVALLKILCRHYWKIEPRFETIKEGESLSCYEAALLIGDEALQKQTTPGYQTIDLGSAWYEMTGLPFVFALFLFKKNVDQTKLNRLELEVNSALDWSGRNLAAIVEEGAKILSLPKELIGEYFKVINFRLGEREMKGLELFKELNATTRGAGVS